MRYLLFLVFLSIVAFAIGIGIYNNSLGMGLGWTITYFVLLVATYNEWKKYL